VKQPLRILSLLLAAGVVLAGPFIRDNGLRAVWVTLGLAASLFCYRALLRRFKAAPAYRRPDR
jgi:hypothetical protein